MLHFVLHLLSIILCIYNINIHIKYYNWLCQFSLFSRDIILYV
jgi:hypothetical protein